ncbi:MAG: peptide chain release factor N(5)-glutamine methyltransferase [Gemmatimonadales bacterium]
MPEVVTGLRALLGEARVRLAAAGIADATQEAIRLWSGLWRISPGAAYLAQDQRIAPEEVEAFERAVARRAAGEPLAYVIGWTGFRHLSLTVDRRVLIPRPETEGVVDLLLERQSIGRVADVGTGSGCLALALADEGEFVAVHAVDLSEEALALAQANARTAGVPVRFHLGDLCVPLVGLGLDAIVSNPPYLTAAEYDRLDPSVKAWEPAQALVSGEDGLRETRRLLNEARGVLGPAGWLVVELDCNRAAQCAALARHFGWAEVEVHQDLFGRDRYLTARRSEA